jgi:ectoine hydroxylase-related dioxygenase (phytanoyl-CoA dioxygenase family)
MDRQESLIDSTDLLGNAAALREKAYEDGYLFLPNLLPREEIQSIRAELLEILAKAGWIDISAPRETAIANLGSFCAEPDPKFVEVFYSQLQLRSINALAHHPALVGLFEQVLDAEVFIHPRLIMRNMFPKKTAFTTPAHQDHPLVQGPRDHWAAWIPFCDCTEEMGGYTLAPGTHGSDWYETEPALGIGQMEIVDLPDRWVHGPTRMGDVIIHHTMLVHRGVPNRSDVMRLSIDCRYQRRRDPVVDRALMPSLQMTDWEHLYQGWDDDAFKYYWKNLGLEIEPFDLTPFDDRDTKAITMGRAKDERARSALVGVIHRHRDAAMREKAREALAVLDGG